MASATEAGEVSKQLLTEPASASLSELPYAPSLSFGQVPNQAEQSQPLPSQSSYLQFDGLVQNYQALAADLQMGSLGRPSSNAAASSTMLQPPEEALSGTQQAMLAAQHAMATARYSAPSHTLVQYPIATPSNLDHSEAEPGLTLTGELQQAITQSSGYPADAVPGNGEVPLDPSRPLAQEDDQASVETQDLNTSPGTKKGRLRRSVRKKRAREGGEQTSRKAPTPITLAVTPVLAAITQAQPIQCLEGENQDCPGLLPLCHVIYHNAVQCSLGVPLVQAFEPHVTLIDWYSFGCTLQHEDRCPHLHYGHVCMSDVTQEQLHSGRPHMHLSILCTQLLW